MEVALPDAHRRKPKLGRQSFSLIVFLTLGVFFLGSLLLPKYGALQNLISPVPVVAEAPSEIFGFAPFWTLSKLENVDWNVLTTFAYFSLPVLADGTIDRTSYEWQVFKSRQLENLFQKAKEHNVKRVVTLTQMEAPVIEEFLANPDAWTKLAEETTQILADKNLDGVNIDFEYLPTDDDLKSQFSSFVDTFVDTLNSKRPDPYITVSVIASTERFNRIYDVGHLAKKVDSVVMMAYDFYYPGSEKIGPSAPLFGYENGDGPFWYDVSTAVHDFIRVADSSKIIMGVPYYGWNYSTYDPQPKTDRNPINSTFATTVDKTQKEKLLETTPFGGWDDKAKVSWRGYWDDNGWHVVYLEDKKSLSYKYDFANEQNLKGVAIWALGFDEGDSLWQVLKEKFENQRTSQVGQI